MLRIHCPHCSQEIILPNQAADRRAKCLHCEGVFRVHVEAPRHAVPAAEAGLHDVPDATAEVITDEQEIAQIERMVADKAAKDDAPSPSPAPPAEPRPQPEPADASPADTDEDAIFDLLTGADDTEMSEAVLANIHNELGIDANESVPRSMDASDTSIDLKAIKENGRATTYLEQLKALRSNLLYELAVAALRRQIELPVRFTSLQAAVKEVVLDLAQVENELDELRQETQLGIGMERQAEILASRHRLTRRRERLQGRVGRRHRRLGKAIFLDKKLSPPIPNLHRKLQQTEERIIMLQD